MWVLILFFMVSVAQASDVIYDKSTKEILFIDDAKSVSLSAEDMARVEIAPAPDRFNKSELSRPVSDYVFKNGKVTLNTKKVSDQEKEQVKEAQRIEEENIDKQELIRKLKDMGFTDRNIKVLVR